MKGILVAMLFILVFPSMAKTISFKEGFDILKGANMDLKKQACLTEAEKKRYEQIKIGYFPVISINGSHSYRSERGEGEIDLGPMGTKTFNTGQYHQTDFAFEANQILFDGSRVKNLAKAKKNNWRAMKEREKALFLNLYESYVLLFYQAVFIGKRTEIVENSIRRVELLLEKTKELYKNGMAIDLDTLYFSNQLLESRISGKKLKAEKEIVMGRLKTLLDCPDLQEVKVDEENLNARMATGLNYFHDQASRRRPEIEQARFSLRSAECLEKGTRSSFFPTIMFKGGYHYGKPGVGFFKNEWMGYFQMGVNLNWDIWTWGRKSNEVREMKELRAYYEIERERIEKEINRQVNEYHTLWKQSKEEVDLKEELLKEERKRFEKGEKRYKGGLISTRDLKEMEIAVTDAEISLAEERIRLRIQAELLKRKAGLTVYDF